MKKILLLAVFLMAIGLVAGVAEDKPLTLSGSVDFSIGDDDLAVAPGPAFSGAKTGAVATFKLGTASDKVEAGITINLAPAITKTDGADADPGIGAGTSSATGYEFLQAMLDWYTYKMAGQDYTDEAGATQTFAVINFTLVAYNSAGLITADGTNFVVADIVAEDPIDIQNDYIAIRTAILAEIDGMSTYDSGDDIIIDGTADEVAARQDEQTMYGDFYGYVWGDDTDDSWASSFPITNAYLKVKKVFGVVDIMAEIEGKAVGVGSMVTNSSTSGNDANYGVSLALSEGVVSGVNASVLVTGYDADMAAAVDPDLETIVYDDADAVEPVWGLQVDAGYAAEMYGAQVQFGVVDLLDLANTWMLSVQPSVSLADIAGLSVNGEFDLVPAGGFGIGAKVGASILGVAPSVGFYYKNAAFGGDDSIDDATAADSITTDSGLMAEFDSIDEADAAALAIAVSADLADLMKMKLVTLNGGFDMMLVGGTDTGWSAGVDFDLAEVLKAPLTVSFSISKWAAEDLLWSGVVGYTYDKLGVTFTLEQTEADVIGWSLAGTVSF